MKETLQNQIERYLLNKMTEEETMIFSEKINGDPLLKNEVELTALIIGATKKVGEKKDLADIDVLRNASSTEIQMLTKRKKVNPFLKTMFWVTSSAAVILVAVVLFNFNKQNNYTEELFASYYQPYVDETEFDRGGSDLSKEDAVFLTDALSLYNNKKYAEALTVFDQISDDNQHTVSIFKAVCLLETGKAKQAVQLLETALSENGEGWEYYQDAQWYLALAYVKSRRIEDAVNLLKIIKEENKFYAPISTDLLEKM